MPNKQKVEAVFWDGQNTEEVDVFLLHQDHEITWEYEQDTERRGVAISYSGKRVVCPKGNWMFRTTSGKLSVCTPGAFEDSYEAAEDANV